MRAGASERHRSRLTAGIVAAGALLLGLNAVVLAVRLGNVLDVYPLFITEGGEGPHIYAIWRLIHGFPLYEWPHREPYSLTFYNFLFYHSYASILFVATAESESLLLYARLITIAFGLLGAGCYAAFMVSFLDTKQTPRVLTAAAISSALFIWFGTNFVSWWALSIRPDVPAAAFALLGLWTVGHASLRGSGLLVLVASLLFFLAWTFKQSVVLLFVGSAFFLLRQRDSRNAMRLVVPFVILAGLTLALGGHAFRFNLLVAPLASDFSLSRGVVTFLRVLVQNALVWFLPVIGFAMERRLEPGRLGGTRRLLRVTTAVALAGGFVALAREGANENHLLEAYLAAGLSGWATVVHLSAQASPRQWRTVLISIIVLIVPMAAFPAAQLAWPNRVGVIRLADEERYDAKRSLARRLEDLPKPIFIVDDILSQPWHSTDGAYPALVLDPVWTDIATRRGWIQALGAADLIRRAKFASVVTVEGSPYEQTAADAGFNCGALDQCPNCDRHLVLCAR